MQTDDSIRRRLIWSCSISECIGYTCVVFLTYSNVCVVFAQVWLSVAVHFVNEAPTTEHRFQQWFTFYSHDKIESSLLLNRDLSFAALQFPALAKCTHSWMYLLNLNWQFYCFCEENPLFYFSFWDHERDRKMFEVQQFHPFYNCCFFISFIFHDAVSSKRFILHTVRHQVGFRLQHIFPYYV